MTDNFSTDPLPDDEPAPPPEEPYPWDEPLARDDPDWPRGRHDAFTEARKCAFLKALVKTGCILDACRLAGPSPRTVYRHQESDPRFLRHCRLALRMAGAPIELTAWERAVEGVEEQFAVGGRVVVRRRYSENLLRLLLQGSNPKKYGPRPGFRRKRLLRHERKQMEKEIRAEMEEPVASFDESIIALDRALVHFGARQDSKRLAEGWTKSPEGHWIPPGYGPIPDWVPPAPTDDAGEPARIQELVPPAAADDAGEPSPLQGLVPSAPVDDTGEPPPIEGSVPLSPPEDAGEPASNSGLAQPPPAANAGEHPPIPGWVPPPPAAGDGEPPSIPGLVPPSAADDAGEPPGDSM